MDTSTLPLGQIVTGELIAAVLRAHEQSGEDFFQLNDRAGPAAERAGLVLPMTGHDDEVVPGHYVLSRVGRVVATIEHDSYHRGYRDGVAAMVSDPTATVVRLLTRK